MEKEQKKLLLVAVSVGVFLLVTITVAIIILTPKVQAADPAYYQALTTQPVNTQPVESFNYNTTQSVTSDFTDNSRQTSVTFDYPETAVSVAESGSNVKIEIPKPTSAAVPDAPEVPASTQPAVVRSSTSQNTQTTGTTTAKTTQPSRSTTASSTVNTSTTAAASTPAAQSSTRVTKTINDFWIQTGAFSVKYRADDAKELLDSKGLISIIENREINGILWYRVRLGPYTSEREANYWLALVKSIDGFDQSEVRQTTRQQ